MSSADPSGSNSNGNSSTNYNNLPRGLLGRHGIPIARGARLPSFKTPRDLTLGGTKPAQKPKFTPNIPVRKNKQCDNIKPKPSSGRQDGRRNQRQRGGNQGGRGRARGLPTNLIQTQGVFAEGPMAMALKRGASVKYERDDASQLTMPKYVPKPVHTNADKEACEKMLQNLFRDDFIDDIEDETNTKINPVQLPLITSLSKAVPDQKPSVKIKKELEEPMEVDEVDAKPDPSLITLKPPETSETLTDFLTNRSEAGTETLLMFQFPDSLPGAMGGRSDEASPILVNRNAPSTSKEEPVEPSSDNRSLGDLPEGLIGKLQFMKSGKIRLKLGSIYLNVERGTQVGFQQDLVSIRTGENDNNLIVLGQIEDNLLCQPDLQDLLRNASD